MRISLLPADFSGPGCYRVLFPGEQLRLAGHDAYTPPWEWVEHKGERVPSIFGMHKFMKHLTPKAMAATMTRKFLDLDCDVYVFHQQSSHHQPYVVKGLRDDGRTVISDTDDYHLGLPHNHPAKESIVGRMNFSNMFLGYSLSNLITVSTPFLADAYSRYGETKVMPNYLDWKMWEDITPRYEQDNERLSIGWFGALDLRGGDLKVLCGLLGPWLRRHPDVDFVVGGKGAEAVHDLLETPEGQRVCVDGFVFPDNAVERINSFDIGLIPLEMTNFNEAKSHLKGLEMNACGIPFIASPSQSYKDYTQEGVNGYLAKRPKHWLRALDALYEDRDLLRRMQVSSRDTAEQNTIQNHWQEWERVYANHVFPRHERLSMEAVGRGALQKD